MLGLLIALGGGIGVSRPQIARAAAANIYCVTSAGGTYAACDQVFTTIQAAVDAATDGEEIRVAAGAYTDMHARPRADVVATGLVTQVVYISKSITIRGGYTTSFSDSPNPVANPTTLDAQGQGRVLYITGDISANIEGLRITGGNATGLGGPLGDVGGGVYIITATVMISNNMILSNTAGSTGFGGGMFIENSPNTILNGNVISDNKAFQAAGLYFRNSPGPRLVANTIANNVADRQGVGMKHYGGARFDNSDNAILTGNTISNNRANDHCGGLSFTNSDNIILIGNQVLDNEATFRHGGGLCLEGGTGATLVGNTVIGNTACTTGGGLDLRGNDATLINNVITDNSIIGPPCFGSEPIVGSGIYISHSNAHLLHTTIARNDGGNGSGAHITGVFGIFSTVILTNTVMTSHSVGIYVAAGNTATLNGVLWYSNVANTDGDGTIIVMNEHTGDPALAAGDYHLTLLSEAIDKGVDTDVKVDIDGDHRPCHTAPDLGADEIGCLYLPVIVKNGV
jgi:parallel beta-helix repeat protein